MSGGVDRIEVVAAYAAEQLREPPLDGLRVIGGDVPYPGEEVREPAARIVRAERHRPRISRYRSEPPGRAVGQQPLDRVHVVDHVPVTDRACPATVVARHASEGRTASGGNVHGEEEAVRPESLVEAIEHEPRLYRSPAPVEVQLHDCVQVLAEVHDQGFTDGLPALRGAGAAGEEGYAVLGGDRDDGRHVGLGPGDGNPDRLDLIDGSVGGVPSAACRIEEHFAFDLPRQPAGEGGVSGAGRRPGPVRMRSLQAGSPAEVKSAANRRGFYPSRPARTALRLGPARTPSGAGVRARPGSYGGPTMGRR